MGARRLSSVLVGVLGVLAVLAGCAPGPDAVPMANSVGFPRTAVVYLEQDQLPPIAELAEHDLVVIDAEWAHRMPRQWFSDLRAANPALVLLAYVILGERPVAIGSRGYYAYRYRLWDYDDRGQSRIPPEWMARTADGRPVVSYPQTTMANLSDLAPAVDGNRFADRAASWLADTVWATGLWDGVMLDVWGDRIYGADVTAWDVDGDGVDESDDEIYGRGGPWERGVSDIEARIRERLPDALILANGDRTGREARLDGLVLESFADRALAGRDPAFDFRRYLESRADPGFREPGLTLTINRRPTDGPQTADDRRRARFFLTGTLMQDGYWAPMGVDYGSLAHYDEVDGGGIGPGYLGRPLVDDPTPDQVTGPFQEGIGQVRPGVYRRDFEFGTVLHNSGTTPVTVPLGSPFRRLRAPDGGAGTVNDGTITDSVTLDGEDGLVLLRP